MTPTIHWLGAGLSSTPGIRRLAAGATPLIVWNLDREQTVASLSEAGVHTDVREFDFPVLGDTVAPGDVVVSMLPATMHMQVAEMCLEQGAHFVSSSYISPAQAALHDEAVTKGLCLVSESGLDPGIDHLFTHLLVHRYATSGALHENNRLSFRSYCGGFPKYPNEFRYKFSWSPLGSLLALTAPARWIENGSHCETTKPWLAVKRVSVAGSDEIFQAYPNRDSVPFIGQYGFETNWNIDEFIRGTLRLDGWAEAWQPVFEQIGAVPRDQAAEELEGLAAELGSEYRYEPGEPDRVVLSVELEARRDGETAWFGSFLIDARGDERGQAMARLVSLPVSLAVDSVLAGDFAPGVHAATAEPRVIENWLATLEQLGETIVRR
jgi:saccharopine dehydrogenase (NADP+, L-glutamate forming)